MPNSMGPSSFALDDSGRVVLEQPTKQAVGPSITLQGGGGSIQGGQSSVAPGGDWQGIANAAFNSSKK